MELDTQRLTIRPLCTTDAEDVFKYASLKDVTESAGWRAHGSLEETAEVLDIWVSEDEKYALVLKETGRVIGHISVDPDSEEDREDTRELGFMLHPDYQHRGLMTEAVQAVVNALFCGGIRYIWACCFKDNPASKALIEKCGFELQQEGEFYSESLDREFGSLEYRMERPE